MRSQSWDRKLGLVLLAALAGEGRPDDAWHIADASHRALVRVWAAPGGAPAHRPVCLTLKPIGLPTAVRAWDVASGREVPAQRSGDRIFLSPETPLAPKQERQFYIYLGHATPDLPAVAKISGDLFVETSVYRAQLDKAEGRKLASLQVKVGDEWTETLSRGVHWWVGRDPQITQESFGELPAVELARGPVFVAYRVEYPDLLAKGNSLVMEYRFFKDFIEIDCRYRAAHPTTLFWFKLPVSVAATGDRPGLWSSSRSRDEGMRMSGPSNKWTPDPVWHDLSYLGESPFGIGVIARNVLDGGGLFYMDSVRKREHEWIYAEPFGWNKPVEVASGFEVKLTIVPHEAGPGRYADTLAKIETATRSSVSEFQTKGGPPIDSDRDGLPDLAELQQRTNPQHADTDLDGSPDGTDEEPLRGTPPQRRLAWPTFKVKPTDRGQTIAEVRPVKGVPTLVLDGKPYGPMIYTRCAGTYEQLNEMGNRGFPVHFEMVGSVGWPGDQLMVLRRLDQRINRFLDEIPNARIILRLYVCNPRRFASDYPEEVLTFNDGTSRRFTKWYAMKDRPLEQRGYPSFASAIWREKTAEALYHYVTHVRQSEYAKNVIGYFVCGGGTEEWYYWGDYDHHRFCVDFSKPMLAAFRGYLRAKYGGAVRVLRRAWNDPAADFATARPPGPSARRSPAEGVFWDPTHEQRVRDYYHVHNKAMEDSLLVFARAVKQACDRQQLVGMFHGYLQNHWLLEGGQATLKELLASPDVDFWSGPPQYNRRGHGEHACIRFPMASLKAHGKLWISESDIRTSYVEPSGSNPALHGRPPDLAESLACLKREFAHQLCEGGNGWWFQMGRNWYHHEPILQLFERMQLCGEAAMGLDRSSNTDIAAVVDLESLLTAPSFTVSPYLLDAFKVQECCRLGAPVDHYELDDVLAPNAKRYKLYLMLNCFSLTDAERQQIDRRLRREGATLVWMFAPGLFNPGRDSERSLEHAAELLGFRLGTEAGGSLAMNMKLSDEGRAAFPSFAPDRAFGSFERPEWVLDPATKGIKERFAKEIRLRQRFYGSGGGRVLARFSDGGKPSMVERRSQNSRDIWIGSVTAPADLLRAIARQAGCHLFVDGDEIVYANHSFLAIHTRTAGERRFRLRRPAGVVEVFSGQVMGDKVTQFTDSVAAYRTRVYYLGDKQDWDANLQRAKEFLTRFRTELVALRKERAQRPRQAAVPPAKRPSTAGPFPLTADGIVWHFLLCGPFPNVSGQGYDTDAIDGESDARPSVGGAYRAMFEAKQGSAEAADWFRGKSGRRELSNSWQAIQVSTAPPLLHEQIPGVFTDQRIVYYVAAYVEIGQRQMVNVGIGSDDGFKLWLNGKLAGGENVTRGVGIDTNRYRVELSAGRNRILLKIVQGGGPTGWCLRLTDLKGEPLRDCKVWLSAGDR